MKDKKIFASYLRGSHFEMGLTIFFSLVPLIIEIDEQSFIKTGFVV